MEKIQLKDVGYSMVLNEKAGRLYSTSSAAIRMFSWPEKKLLAKNNMEYAKLKLSDRGNYASGLNALGMQMIFDTSEGLRPIYKRKWKNPLGSHQCAFYGESELLVTNQGNLYAIPLKEPETTVCLFKKDELAQLCGKSAVDRIKIHTLSVFHEKILLFINFAPTKWTNADHVVILNSLQDTSPTVIKVPEEYGYYEDALWDNRGKFVLTGYALIDENGYVLTGEVNGIEHRLEYRLLWYPQEPRSEDVKPMSMPFPCNPHLAPTGLKFSPDGRYFTFIAFDEKEAMAAYLVSTDTWETLEKDEQLLHTEVSFSTDGHYWLVGSSKPFIYRIE